MALWALLLGIKAIYHISLFGSSWKEGPYAAPGGDPIVEAQASKESFPTSA